MAEENRNGTIDDYAALCRQVEATAGETIETAKQFEDLSQKIFDRTGVLLSPTTLKRIWKYLDEPVNPRRSTLDVLARFCGWRDYSDFISGTVPEIESGNVGAYVIRAGKDIRPGERVRLFWRPGRVCDIEFIGGLEWKVIRSEGSRLTPGDFFSCALIVSGEPLYLDNLRHEGTVPGVYVCGSRTGITFRKL